MRSIGGQLPTSNEFPAGFVDAPATGTIVPREPLRVAGWALDVDGPVTAAVVVVDGQKVATARVGLGREDVAARYPDVPSAGRAGWEADVDLRLAAGPVITISLIARTAAGAWAEIDRSEVQVEGSPGLTDGPRTRAVFTIAQNEPRFLPLWLGYYGHHFEPSDIYVLDHDSTDGSTNGIAEACNVVTIHRSKSFDHIWLKSTVERFQSFLLSSYDAVLFAEVDEFVVADPRRHGGLRSYIDNLRDTAACCTGYNVLQYPDEPPLRFDQPLLRQRRYWHPSTRYSKRLLGRIPLAWGTGFHTETNAPTVLPDPGLYLIHLHRVDYAYCLTRHREAARRDWNEADVRAGLGRQYHVVESEEFAEWFFHGDDLEGTSRELIPDHLRGAL